MDKERKRSIATEYKKGYSVILGCVIIMFAAASMGNWMLSLGYGSALDELLELNQLFVEIETANMAVSDAYLYLRESSMKGYEDERENVRRQISVVEQQVAREYSRAKKDLACMTETYLEECDDLIALLKSYGSQENPQKVSDKEIDRSFRATQEVMDYINTSFKDIYSIELTVSLEKKQTMAQISQSIGFLQIGLLVLVLAIYLKHNLRIIRNISDSLGQLTRFVECIKGNLYHTERLELRSHDELMILADTMNDMLDIIQKQVGQLEQDSQIRAQIKEMEIDNLRLKNELQSSQMNLLQSRINPHFLFNTLNMISNSAVMEDAEQTRTLIDITAEYLRYNLDRLTKTVSLSEEIENLKDYIYIQKCRFEDRFTFAFELDMDCGMQKMPCMILQPLVENALKHGIHNMLTGGKVTIRTRQAPAYTVIEIEDNGCGFPEEYITKIRNGELEYEKDGHVGIRNIYMRLKLFYHSEIVFDVDSYPGRTVLHIEVPRQGTLQGE